MRYVAIGRESGICPHLHETIDGADACAADHKLTHPESDRVPCAISTALHFAIRHGDASLRQEILRRYDRVEREPADTTVTHK